MQHHLTTGQQNTSLTTPQQAVAEARSVVFGAFYFYFSWQSEAGGNALPRGDVT